MALQEVRHDLHDLIYAQLLSNVAVCVCVIFFGGSGEVLLGGTDISISKLASDISISKLASVRADPRSTFGLWQPLLGVGIGVRGGGARWRCAVEAGWETASRMWRGGATALCLRTVWWYRLAVECCPFLICFVCPTLMCLQKHSRNHVNFTHHLRMHFVAYTCMCTHAYARTHR